MSFIEKTVESEYLYRGKIINLRKDKIEQPDGKQFLREIVEHNGGVGIVAFDLEGNVILVTQYRKPFEEVLIEIPAGKLEKDEVPIECAAREMEEETGFKPIKLDLMTVVYPSPGFLTEKLYIYFCNQMQQGILNFDEGEHLTSQHIPYDKAIEMIHSGEIKDGKTIIGLLMAKQFRNLKK
jgi:ADP-ribose pyrophosphatase